MAVSFHEQTGVLLKERKKLKAFIAKIFSLEGQHFDKLDIIFCTDEYLKSINIQFLHHDYYTDIITFDLTTPPKKGTTGEIYISIDRVKENAIINNEPFTAELHRVIFHGILHLCGYKDKLPADKAIMTTKENHYLNLYF